MTTLSGYSTTHDLWGTRFSQMRSTRSRCT